MRRGDLFVMAAIVSWMGWLVTLAAFFLLNDDRLLARVVFGTNVAAWRATMDIIALMFLALSLLGFAFVIALMEMKPDADRS